MYPTPATNNTNKTAHPNTIPRHPQGPRRNSINPSTINHALTTATPNTPTQTPAAPANTVPTLNATNNAQHTTNPCETLIRHHPIT